MTLSDANAAKAPFSCAIFYDASSDRVLLHLRDEAAPRNPSMWGLFGGTSEGEETPFECLRRELFEELELVIEEAEATLVRSYVNPRSGRTRHVFVVRRVIDPATTPLHEGAGMQWLTWEQIDHLPLTEPTRDDLTYFRQARVTP